MELRRVTVFIALAVLHFHAALGFPEKRGGDVSDAEDIAAFADDVDFDVSDAEDVADFADVGYVDDGSLQFQGKRGTFADGAREKRGGVSHAEDVADFAVGNVDGDDGSLQFQGKRGTFAVGAREKRTLGFSVRKILGGGNSPKPIERLFGMKGSKSNEQLSEKSNPWSKDSSGKKSSRQKTEIGLPTNFQHIEHMEAHDIKGFGATGWITKPLYPGGIDLTVPTIVAECIKAVESSLSEEGIYRKPGVEEKVKKFYADFMAKKHVDFGEDGVHTAASILKKFFREMDPHLLLCPTDFTEIKKKETFVLRDGHFAACVTKPEGGTCKKVKDTVKYLVRHLQDVAESQKLSDLPENKKMTPSTLAIVFGPTLCQRSSDPMEDLRFSGSFNAFVEELIETNMFGTGLEQEKV